MGLVALRYVASSPDRGWNCTGGRFFTELPGSPVSRVSRKNCQGPIVCGSPEVIGFSAFLSFLDIGVSLLKKTVRVHSEKCGPGAAVLLTQHPTGASLPPGPSCTGPAPQTWACFSMRVPSCTRPSSPPDPGPLSTRAPRAPGPSSSLQPG